jgi:hypothetical protein
MQGDEDEAILADTVEHDLPELISSPKRNRDEKCA